MAGEKEAMPSQKRRYANQRYATSACSNARPYCGTQECKELHRQDKDQDREGDPLRGSTSARFEPLQRFGPASAKSGPCVRAHNDTDTRHPPDLSAVAKSPLFVPACSPALLSVAPAAASCINCPRSSEVSFRPLCARLLLGTRSFLERCDSAAPECYSTLPRE